MQTIPDFKALLNIDSSRLIADQVVDAVGDNFEYFKTVLELCFSEKYPVSMRAARVISLCNEKYPTLIIPYLDQLIKMIAKSKIDGVKRGILKTFKESVDLKLFTNLGELVDICFEWLMNPKEAVAVRYYCIKILTKICVIEPELKNEFITVLENISFESSSGMANLAKKMVTQMQKH